MADERGVRVLMMGRTNSGSTDDTVADPSSILTERTCHRCRYPISPGWEHVDMVQPEGANVVVCDVRKIEMLRQFGKCETCGVWASRVTRVDDGTTVTAFHNGPHDSKHEAKPGAAPLGETLAAYMAQVLPDRGDEDR